MSLQIPKNFFRPTEANFPSGKMTTLLPDETTPYYFENGAGLRFEAELVRKCIMEGQFVYDFIIVYNGIIANIVYNPFCSNLKYLTSFPACWQYVLNTYV